MKKIMEIISLSESKVSEDSYIIVLSDTEDSLRVPIVINNTEAITIANIIGDLNVDLNQSVYDTILDIILLNDNTISEVLVSDFIDGLFEVFIMINGNPIPCRIGDALVLACIFNVNIYFTDEILEKVSIINDNTPVLYDVDNTEVSKTTESLIEELEKDLKKCIEDEDYERASELKDLIDKLKEN